MGAGLFACHLINETPIEFTSPSPLPAHPFHVGAKCCGICLHPPPPLLHTLLVFDSGPPLIKLQGVPQLASVCPVQTQGGVAGVPGSVGGRRS